MLKFLVILPIFLTACTTTTKTVLAPIEFPQGTFEPCPVDLREIKDLQDGVRNYADLIAANRCNSGKLKTADQIYQDYQEALKNN